MQQTIRSENPDLPTPERFGLTEKRVDYFTKATETNIFTILIAMTVNIVCCVSLVEFIFPHADVPVLLLLFLSVCPGFLIGSHFDGRRISKVKETPDYRTYLDYCDALKSYKNLLSKMRRQEFKSQRTKQYDAGKQQEWWKGVDGRGFELGVAKLLLDKGYNVRHTGSSYGDEGIDIELKAHGKRIIIQCKAFRTYVSAGPVRELYGTLLHQKADEGWLVVTSGFYSGAKTFAIGKPIRLFTARDLTRLPSHQPEGS
jgi:uncharacterized integral membrane protein